MRWKISEAFYHFAENRKSELHRSAQPHFNEIDCTKVIQPLGLTNMLHIF